MSTNRNGCNSLVETALVILCLLSTRVDSLKCFECTLSENGCASTANMTATDCTLSLFTLKNDPQQPDDEYRCLKTIERNGTGMLYTRRCAYKYEANICNETIAAVTDNRNVELVECNLCNEDYCNFAPDTSRLSSTYSYLYPFLVYFMISR